jgi:ElaB/YqjD/DUF883 family membrane-anchored ribosome-binding protein
MAEFDFDQFLEDDDFISESEEEGEPRQEREQQIDTTRFSGDALNVGSQTNQLIDAFKDRFLDVREVFREIPKNVPERARGKLSDQRSEMKERLKEYRRKVKREIRNSNVTVEGLTDLLNDLEIVRDELLEGWTKLQNIRRQVLQDVDNEMKEEIGDIRRELKDSLRETKNVLEVSRNNQ